MENDTLYTEEAFQTKEVALQLDISPSTIRKWCLLLEELDYKLMRNDKNQRVFVKSNIHVLKHIKELTQTEGMMLHDAIKQAIKENITIEKTGHNEQRTSDMSRYDKKINMLLEHVERQEEFNQDLKLFNKELISRLDEQQKYINERLDARDQKLMESLKETLEVKKQIASTKQTKTQIGFWRRLFSKSK
ncbi:DUF3967 domain-containing protein [Bacillus sp. SCS-151]|uniref:DUF3967 domain-containing protein n=1 Tax=Nanhaiella sioensis TaxID=3115293 RepID=UPI0039784AB9